MIEELAVATDFSISIVKIMLILMILPYFIGALLKVIYSLVGLFLSLEKKPFHRKIQVIKSPDHRTTETIKGYTYIINRYKQSRRTSEVARFVSATTFPGTLLRMALMFLLLRLKGWELTISYPGLVGTQNRSLSDQRRNGFFISMRPNNFRKINLKDTIHMSLIGYIPMILAYFMWIYRNDLIDFMIYLQQGNVNIIWIYVIYYYLIFAVLIGGAPIPEETMVPIYHLIGRYPHILIGIIFSYIISFLISLMQLDHLGFSANQVADTYFLLFSSIIFVRVLLDEKKLKITRKELDQRSLQMELIDLI